MVLGLYSPRMWRWSSRLLCPRTFLTVFSTYVEVIPSCESRGAEDASILHVCGGDPIAKTIFNKSNWYSPRMWRWSSPFHFTPISWGVFSTYVEVIPLRLCFIHVKCSILHVCGGDPFKLISENGFHWYSPRMWRWSLLQSPKHLECVVFSTYVEVILWWVKND